MPEAPPEPALIDLRAWIDEAAGDRARHDQRQITAIILNAVALSEALRANLVLKGGTLLAVAHGSRRQTGDVDFTARADPEAFAETFAGEMDRGLDRARARLGYVQWRCRVQGKLKRQPRNFGDDRFPSLAARIGYARAGSRDEAQLLAGNCTHTIPVEVSFREPLVQTEEVRILAGNARIEVYSVTEVLAEKFRAYLQQGIRNRRRRQDIYDIAYLVGQAGADGIDRAAVLSTLREKCAARDVPLGPDLIDDPDLIDRARSEWRTMALEVGDLPSFDECFAVARHLYASLPWSRGASGPGGRDLEG